MCWMSAKGFRIQEFQAGAVRLTRQLISWNPPSGNRDSPTMPLLWIVSYSCIASLDTLAFWKQLHVPVLLICGEDDQLVAVDESLAKLEASLDAVKTPYTAVIVPNAQHNLTVQPEPNAAFFWWKAAPGIFDLVVAWVQQRTTESSR